MSSPEPSHARRRRWWVLGALAALVLAGAAVTASSSPHRHFTQQGYEVDTFTLDSINSHVLRAGDALVLIDPGYEKNGPALEAAMRAAGLDPAAVAAIVLTHAHADHAGAARTFQQKFHARVLVGAGDEGMLGTGANEPVCPTGLLGRLRRSTDEGATYTPFTSDLTVSAPVELSTLARVPGRVVPLPGHTKGSLVVVAGDAAFVGDLFRGAVVGSGAATHLYMCDLEDNRRDVARLLTELAPEAKRFYVGHFGPVSREDVAAHFGVGP